MFERKNKKSNNTKAKGLRRSKTKFFCETKKTRIAILFQMTCRTAPHLPYGPNSSQKRILRKKTKNLRVAPSLGSPSEAPVYSPGNH